MRTNQIHFLINWRNRMNTKPEAFPDDVALVSQSTMNQYAEFFRLDNKCSIDAYALETVRRIFCSLSNANNANQIVNSIYSTICDRIYYPIDYESRCSNYISDDVPMYSKYACSISDNKIIDACVVDKSSTTVIALFLLITSSYMSADKRLPEINEDSFFTLVNKTQVLDALLLNKK